MAAGENRLGVPPPRKMLVSGRTCDRPALGIQIAQQRVDVALLGQFLAQRVRIEVAVRAFLHAPRKVRVQRERRRFHRAASAKLREKCAQRLAAMAMRVVSQSAGISATVRVSPRGMKIGS